MKLTIQNIINLNHIQSFEIEQDIKDTQDEIDNYKKQIDLLKFNPQQNKLDIYLAEGNILKRQEFINELNQILEYRKNNNII